MTLQDTIKAITKKGLAEVDYTGRELKTRATCPKESEILELWRKFRDGKLDPESQAVLITFGAILGPLSVGLGWRIILEYWNKE